MKSLSWKWILGVTYIVAVAGIWIAASYVVQSVVNDGISPSLITYICNSLFVMYIPLVEISRFLEDYTGKLCFWRSRTSVGLLELARSEEVILLEKSDLDEQVGSFSHNVVVDQEERSKKIGQRDFNFSIDINVVEKAQAYGIKVDEDPSFELDAKGRSMHSRVAKVSLLICLFWFLAQLTFNLSL